MGVLRGHRRGIWSVQFSPVDQVRGSTPHLLLLPLISLFVFPPYTPTLLSLPLVALPHCFTPISPSLFPFSLPPPPLSVLLPLYPLSPSLSLPCSPSFFPLFPLSSPSYPPLPLFPPLLPSSPLSQCVLTASADTTLKLWAVNDCSCIKTFEGHTMSVLKAVFITRGMQIASRSPVYTIHDIIVHSLEVYKSNREHSVPSSIYTFSR